MRLLAALMTCTLMVGGVVADAQSATREELLAALYPGAAVRTEQVFLTGDEQRQVGELARVEVPSALVARYIASHGNTIVGRAYVDTHVVRTKRESLLIALDADARVLRVEVTAFLEPPEFKASEVWLRQYRGRFLGDGLALNRDIRPLSGATLTTRAVNAAVRRALAIDSTLRLRGGTQ